MSDSSRRDFLKFSTAALASAAITSKLSATARAASPSGEVRAWSTYGTRRFAPESALSWQPATGSAADAITLDPSKRFQEILGFGGAFTDASCYMFNSMPAAAREELLHDFFSPDAMNFSVCRGCVGSSDYSTKAYSYDYSPHPDPMLKNFSIEHDRAYIIPTMAAARKVNPDLFLFASPWSPPGWMKANNSLLGGSMRKANYAPYAQYFLKFLRGYQEAGVKIDAVTVQNEVDTDQDGRMPACLWWQEYEIEFIKGHLGPVLREYIVGEAIAALGVPTTRALAAVATGQPVLRETALPGAVLTRVAASHIRVGTFQYIAAQGDTEALRRLADYVIDNSGALELTRRQVERIYTELRAVAPSATRGK